MKAKNPRIESVTMPTLRRNLSQALTWGGAWSVYVWPDGRCEYISGMALFCDLDGIRKRLADGGAQLFYNHHAAAEVLTREESFSAQEEDAANKAAVEKIIKEARLREEVEAYV